MCRGKSEGGRRCAGCVGRTGLDKHNARRRKNRNIRRHLLEWAEQQGLAGTDLRDLQAAPPIAVKQWAQAQGLIAEKFAEGIPDRVRPQLAAGLPAIGLPPRAAGPRHRRSPTPAAPTPAVPTPAAPAPAPGVPGWMTSPWCTAELQGQIQAAMTSQGAHRDERSLLSGAPVKVKTLTRSGSSGGSGAGGTNTTRRVKLDNGVVGYFKPFDGVDDRIASGFGQDSSQQSMHEAAAWQLASRMGPPWSEIVPPVVVREINGEVGSLALERPGQGMNYSPWHATEWREAAFFDSLIGQQDRHPGNYLVAGDRLALIDHGYTFAKPGDYQNYSWFVSSRSRNAPGLTYQERDVVQRLVASPDLLGLTGLLQPARAAALRARAETMLATGQISDTY